MKCWGANTAGVLGSATLLSGPTPVNVVGLGCGVAAVSAGLAHARALTSAGAVSCWGFNNLGQLGDGTMTDSPVPVAVKGL